MFRASKATLRGKHLAIKGGTETTGECVGDLSLRNKDAH